MIVSMVPEATQEQIQHVCERINRFGHVPLIIGGAEQTIVGVKGVMGSGENLLSALGACGGVDSVVRVSDPFKFVNRKNASCPSRVRVADLEIGNGAFVIMAGPCSVDLRNALLETARFLADCGVQILRGGAYKPRTSPMAFQGLGEAGLEILAEAREATGMKIVTEVLSTEDVNTVGQYTDIFQIGARNSQNFRLLTMVGRYPKKLPVMLKRGPSMTYSELLQAADYIASEGNYNIVLCERGIRTFESGTRNTLDLAAVPYLRQHTNLPIIVDPSHGTGRRALVHPMAIAGMMTGADGIMVEVCGNPEDSPSDADQILDHEEFGSLMEDVRMCLPVWGRLREKQRRPRLQPAAV